MMVGRSRRGRHWTKREIFSPLPKPLRFVAAMLRMVWRLPIDVRLAPGLGHFHAGRR